MVIIVEAVYENGMLKPVHVLPIPEYARVQITVQMAESPILQAYGIMGWHGSADEADLFARDAEFDPLEDS